MKTHFSIALFLLSTLSIFAQKEVNLDSEIKKVTVFFSGAQIEHYKSSELKAGRQELVFTKLTDFVDPNSVQVKAKGELTILSVRTRKNYEDLKISNAELNELNKQIEKLEAKDLILRDEFNILSYDKDLLLKNRDLKGNDQGLKVTELKEAYAFMHTKLTEITARQSAIKSELEGIDKEINRIEQEVYAQRSKPVLNYTEVIVEVDVPKPTKGEFFFSYISPNASWKPYYDMRSDGIGKPVRLESKAIVSQTTGIEWKNIDLVLSTNDPYENSAEPKLNPWYIHYNNYPQQRQVGQRQVPTYDYSGEKLRGEVIDASTGEPLAFAKINFPSYPNQGAMTDFDGKFEITVPKGEKWVNATFIGYDTKQLQISSHYLKFFLKPQKMELQEVQVTSSSVSRLDSKNIDAVSVEMMSTRGSRKKKDKSQIMYDYDDSRAAAGASYTWSNNAATTVVQKDLRVEFVIETKFTIPSDGADHRVHINDHVLPASYEYHSAPKLDPSVFLTAQVTGWEKLNLLSGESNLYFDGTFIGKTYVDINSTKDTLTFSLGKDNKVQIERVRIQEKSSNKIIGNRRKFEVGWEIKIRNNGGAAIPLLIKDQFPISTDADIKIKRGDYNEASLDDKTGILTWRLMINSGQSKSLFFDYSVDYLNGRVIYIE